MHFKASFKGALSSLVILFLLSLCLGTYYHFGSISTQFLNYLISFIVATSFLLGGFIGGYSSGQKGLITGLIGAMMLILVVWFITALGADSAKNWAQFAINCGFALAASAIGGIIGVSKN